MTLPAGERVRRWRDLDSQVKRVEAELKRLKRQRDQAEDAVLSAFEREGVSQIRVDGKTVFLRRDLLVSPKAGQSAAITQWLIANGHSSLVPEPTVNSRTLAAFVREQERGEALDPELKAMIHVHEDFRVRATKGSGA